MAMIFTSISQKRKTHHSALTKREREGNREIVSDYGLKLLYATVYGVRRGAGPADAGVTGVTGGGSSD